MRKSAIVFLVVILSSFPILIAHSQLGEVAGVLNFNTPIGSSSSLNLTIMNTESIPLKYSVVLPVLNQIPNSTTPIVTITPMNGTLAPHAQKELNVTVHLPYNKNKPGYAWQGLIQVIGASPSTPGEVNIQAGVAKLITIVAAEPKQNPLLIPELVAGVVLAAALAYFLYLKLSDIFRSAKPAAIHPARIKPNGSAAKTRMAGGKRRKRARVRKSGRGGSPPKRMARRGSAQGPKRAGKARQKRGRQPA